MKTFELILIGFVFLVFILGTFFLILSINYNFEVKRCCQILVLTKFYENNNYSTCYHWSFLDHIKGIKGCSLGDKI